MSFCNDRFPISTHTFFKFFLLLQILTMPFTAHAQWSQTLGWGGAGYGKRSLDSYTNTARQSSSKTCSPNPVILQIIKRLIENEITRLQDCSYGTKDTVKDAQTLFADYFAK